MYPNNSITYLKLERLKRTKSLHSMTLSKDNCSDLKLIERPSYIFGQTSNMFSFWKFFLRQSKRLIITYKVENQALRERLHESEKQKEELENYIHYLLNVKQQKQISRIESLAKIFES